MVEMVHTVMACGCSNLLRTESAKDNMCHHVSGMERLAY
jgi:hypothetical protein